MADTLAVGAEGKGHSWVRMTLNMEPEAFEKVRDEFLIDLARILKVSTLEIEITSVRRGCTELELKIPANVRELYQLINTSEKNIPPAALVEIANFVRKYKVVVFEDLRPAIISRGTAVSEERDNSDRSLTWLHLSDVHFESPTSGTRTNHWAQDKIKETFIRDLPDLLRSEQLDPDFVFLTGDIAFSGDPSEYDLAYEFLEELQKRLPRKEPIPVVMIPGNHDVSRNAVRRFSREEEAAQKLLTSNEKIIEYMRSPVHGDDRERVFNRLAAYSAFSDRCRRFGQPPPNHSEVITMIHEHKGLKVGVAGMNSAWRCGSDDDHGRLVLGIPQIDDAIRQLANTDIRVALIHHPPESDWFVVDDMRYQREYLSFFDFVLRGHEHDPRVQLSFFSGREYCHVSAGALYSTDVYQKSFNVIQLDPESSNAWAFFWKLAPGTFKWVKDVELYHNGYQLFRLPPKLTERLAEAGKGSRADLEGHGIGS